VYIFDCFVFLSCTEGRN